MLFTELKMLPVFKNKGTHVVNVKGLKYKQTEMVQQHDFLLSDSWKTELGEYFSNIFVGAPQLVRDDPGEPGAGITSYSWITLAHIGHQGLQRKGQYSLKYKSGVNTADIHTLDQGDDV